MRSVLITALVVMVLVLAFMLHSQSVPIKSLQSAAAAQPVRASLESQEKCARQAEAVFKEMGYGAKGSDDFSDHFSSKSGRCIVVIESTSVNTATSSTSKTLSNAFEGKVYGSYLWINVLKEGKKYWEVAPFECKVTLPSGEEKQCHSSDEWEQLVKVYMDSD